MSILVYTENWEGKFKKASFELVSFAKAIADQMNDKVVAVTIGNVNETELKLLANYGASKIICSSTEGLDHLNNRIYTGIIEKIASDENSQVIVLGHNLSGKALAPRLSVRLKAGLVAGVNALPSSLNPFIIRKTVYTGKAYANVEVKTAVKIVTLASNSFEIKESPVTADIQIQKANFDDSLLTTKVTDINKVTGKILLTDAEVVVSGGRGMKGPEFWQPLEELAGMLGAATACSRPVSDEGWRSHHEHVGQTGKIIAPNVYIALGISGAIQHVGGISASKKILAVNKDKDAPIFESADFGVVGDVHKILPELNNAIKQFKETN